MIETASDSNHPFDPILNKDEKLFWAGQPNQAIFLMTGIPFLILGCIWGSFDLFGFILPMANGKSGIPAGFIIPFFMLHLFPFWASVLNMFRLFLVRNKTWYGFTNKRLLFRTGFWGVDFRSVDYDKVSGISVIVDPIEKMFNVGTVLAMATAQGRGSIAGSSFIGIQHPYDVLKKLEEVCVNVKTDWSYPNALRPAENPGYHTEYAAGNPSPDVPKT